MFMNRTRVRATPVSPVSVLLALVAVCALPFAAAQGGASSDRAVSLFGSNEWVLVSLEGPGGPVELLPGGVAVFELTDIGNLAGTAGCNRLGAMITFGEGISIEFGRVIATRMACAEPQMAQEFAVIEALESVDQYEVTNGNIVLSGGGHVLVLASRSPGGSTAVGGEGQNPPVETVDHAEAVARFAASFNEAVAAAATAGAEWPSDPIRVALAFLELRGAPNTIITRADVGAENATQTVVTVMEDGFLDDSVSGLEQTVNLERVGATWSVTSYSGMWHCRRPGGTTVAVPGVCL